MQKFYVKHDMQNGNPLANVLVVIIGAIVIGVSVVLGFFAFLALSAIILLASIVIGVRSWWLRRRMPSSAEHATHVHGEFIEGEFHVVKKDKNS